MSELTTPPVTQKERDEEHAELNQQIADWRSWWEELQQLGLPHFGEMGDRVARFRETLAAHFHHEEFSGPFADLTETAEPANQLQIKEFWQEHHRILEALDGLVQKLKKCQPEESCWTAARSEFETVIQQFEAQEQREDELLKKIR